MGLDRLCEHLDLPDSDIGAIISAEELGQRYCTKPSTEGRIIIKLAKEILFLRRELRRAGVIIVVVPNAPGG